MTTYGKWPETGLGRKLGHILYLIKTRNNATRGRVENGLISSFKKLKRLNVQFIETLGKVK